ncbi:hypothetical protein B0H13DRAFT_2323134 [Mycena leptocephala]|nr:hypothetical protein B0H13DRAFT_2323134 [Mycena leptocephala]
MSSASSSFPFPAPADVAFPILEGVIGWAPIAVETILPYWLRAHAGDPSIPESRLLPDGNWVTAHECHELTTPYWRHGPPSHTTPLLESWTEARNLKQLFGHKYPEAHPHRTAQNKVFLRDSVLIGNLPACAHAIYQRHIVILAQIADAEEIVSAAIACLSTDGYLGAWLDLPVSKVHLLGVETLTVPLSGIWGTTAIPQTDNSGNGWGNTTGWGNVGGWGTGGGWGDEHRRRGQARRPRCSLRHMAAHVAFRKPRRVLPTRLIGSSRFCWRRARARAV